MAKPPDDELIKLRQAAGTVSRHDLRKAAQDLVEQQQPQQVQQAQKKPRRSRKRKQPD